MTIITPKSIKLLLAACLLPLLLAGPGRAEVVDRIVAVVNDEIITMSELEQMAQVLGAQSGQNPQRVKRDKALQRQLLDALIDRKLVKEEAKRRGIAVSDKELVHALDEFKKRNGVPDDAALNQALAKSGLTLKDLKQQITEQIQYDRMLQVAMGGKIKVSEAEVRRYYEQKYAKGSGKQQVHLKTIAMPFPAGATEAQKEEMRERAEAILKEYRETKSLEGIKAKYSLDANDLGYVTQEDLNPQLSEFLNKHKPGEMAPIMTPEGFQLVLILDRRSGKARSFEEVEGEIRQILSSQDVEKVLSEWVKTLRDKAHIKVML